MASLVKFSKMDNDGFVVTDAKPKRVVMFFKNRCIADVTIEEMPEIPEETPEETEVKSTKSTKSSLPLATFEELQSLDAGEIFKLANVKHPIRKEPKLTGIPCRNCGEEWVYDHEKRDCMEGLVGFNCRTVEKCPNCHQPGNHASDREFGTYYSCPRFYD
jgi:formylmethanofuran dehydrogenase subunit E